MSHLPLVTVRISAYNHERFVEEAVLSVINQTYPNIELLVIDDGSKDKTPEILERLSKEHGFYFERQANQGLSRTLNKLNRMAKGKYIAGVASDDFYPPDKIEKCVAYMEAHPEFGFCHGRSTVVDEQSKALPGDQGEGKTRDWCEGDLFKTLFVRGCFIAGPTTMVRKSALDAVGPYDEDCPIEDWDMWLRLARKFPVGFLEENLAFYRRHGTNTYWSRKNYYRMYRAERHILNKWRDEPEYPAVRDRFYLRWFYRLAVSNRGTALRYALKSLPQAGKLKYWKAWLRFFSGELFSGPRHAG